MVSNSNSASYCSDAELVFKDKFSQFLDLLAEKEHKTSDELYFDLFAMLQDAGLSKPRHTDNLIRFRRRGGIPDDRREMEFWARLVYERAGIHDRQWLDDFLSTHEFYRSNPPFRELLLDSLCKIESLPTPEPYWLPLRQVNKLLGRETELKQVWHWLNAEDKPIGVIVGMGGVGKTTLAIETVYACARKTGSHGLPWLKFDAIIWVDGKNTLELDDLLDFLVHRLGYSALLRLSHRELRQWVQEILVKQFVLLIVDNLETISDPEIYHFLAHLPPPQKCDSNSDKGHLKHYCGVKVLLISREGGSLLPSPFFQTFPPQVELEGFSEADAYAFLEREIADTLPGRSERQQQRLRAFRHDLPQAIAVLYRITQGNPQALRMTVDYVADYSMPIQRLQEDREAIADLVDNPCNYFFIETWRNRCDENERAIWRVLSFFSDSAPRPALAAACGLDTRLFVRASERMLKRYVLYHHPQEDDASSPAIQRYTAHPLAHSFADERAREFPEWIAEARLRWIRFFCDWLQNELGQPHVNDGSWWTSLDNSDRYPLFRNDIKQTLLPALEMAYQQRLWLEVRTLSINMIHLLWYEGYPRERLRTAQFAIHALDHLIAAERDEIKIHQYQLEQAWLHLDAITWVYLMLRDDPAARRELKIGMDIAYTILSEVAPDSPEACSARDGIVLARRFLAQLDLAQGHECEAEAALSALLEQDCSRRILGRVRNTLGRIKILRGDHAAALTCFKQALEDSYPFEHTEIMWNHLWMGEACIVVSNYQQARKHLNEAMPHAQLIADQPTMAFLERAWGRLEMGCGQLAIAEHWLIHSCERFERQDLRAEMQATRGELDRLRQIREANQQS